MGQQRQVNPSHYPRRVLLCVTGLSPQVVTETLFALVTEHGFVPTELHVITTATGHARVSQDLLAVPDGHFFAFCRDYGLTGKIRFDASCIHVISDSAGRPLPDIRTPEDNLMAADMMTRLVRQLCSDEMSCLHVSIAGGRKSMGFLLGYVFSLFARPQDALSHVLVSEPFENHPDFFYPPPVPGKLAGRDGSLLDVSQAKVMLAVIPLVHLRSGLPSALLHRGSYAETVDAAQGSIWPPPELRFNLPKKEVVCAGQAVRLPPALLAVFLWLAVRKKYAGEAGSAICPGRDEGLIAAFLPYYKMVTPAFSLDYENAVRSLKTGADFMEYFRSSRSKLHARLKRQLGAATAFSFEIRSFGKRPFTCYELALPADAIVLPDGMDVRPFFLPVQQGGENKKNA